MNEAYAWYRNLGVDTRRCRADGKLLGSVVGNTYGGKPRNGKWLKRIRSRARRRAWRDAHERGLAAANSTLNYRGF